MLVALGLLPGCVVGGGQEVKQFAPPPPDVMPRRVLIVKRGEADSDLDSYIDGVLVEVYLFNSDRTDEGADQPFHRDGKLAFKLFGPEAEVLCEGEFDAATMARSQAAGFFGPGYGLRIDFSSRGYADIRDRTAARLDVEFTPTADPEQRAFGSTQIRLGPVF
jgi:hypothetical protein